MTRRRAKKIAAKAFAAPALIAAKRDGQELSDEEIRWLVEAFTSGEVADYQMSAFAMAVLLRGMGPRETAALTLAMRDSGRCADLSRCTRPKVDKHSTGGVGDKVSLCLAPLMAACGLAVPMISGRGLGHTGGTLDKLEAIDGFEVDLPLRRFQSLVQKYGFAMIGQTADLAPADRRLYALRDVTATVESIPLITASILSKKLAEDLDALVLDVKVGRGAFMKKLEDARALARSIVQVGSHAGTKVTAVITAMDQPLGKCVGNALETREAFELLSGRAPEDLLQCTMTLGYEMLRAGGLFTRRAAAERAMAEAIDSGRARVAMERLCAAQGGDGRVVAEPDRLPRASVIETIESPASGHVQELDALAIGQLAVRIGAGRSRADQDVDPAVGFVLHKKCGDRVKRGEVLAELHLASRSDLQRVRADLLAAYGIGRARREPGPLVIETLRRRA
ncbi:MAG: thymidine phosphorylase [Myxococcales bacterium]|nr:thymidine phosphorylase [Myxococcales bacterium]